MIKTIRPDQILDVIEVPELWQWEFIVVHHTVNNIIVPTRHWGKMIDEYHRRGKREGYPKFRNGMGYHFLINPDGVIEVGDRWINQIYGAHCLGYNKRAIGIAFVGNFSDLDNLPTVAQQASFEAIRNNLPNLKLYPHCAFRNTECPGKNLDLRNWFRLFESEVF